MGGMPAKPPIIVYAPKPKPRPAPKPDYVMKAGRIVTAKDPRRLPRQPNVEQVADPKADAMVRKFFARTVRPTR